MLIKDIYESSNDQQNNDIHEDAVARVLLHDSNGNIWLGLGAGLYRYIKETDTFIYYDLPVDHEVTAICECERDVLLIGTDKGAAFLFNNSGRGTCAQVAQIDSRIHDFHSETGGRNILIGSDAGLFIYDKVLRRVVRSTDELAHQSIYRFFEDREGALWVGTYFCGVYYRHPGY